MQVIQAFLEGDQTPRTLAAFEIRGGRAVFDRTRGDDEFVKHIQEKGLSIDGENPVSPEDGVGFLQACEAHFNGFPMYCFDEDMLEQSRVFGDRRPSTTPPRSSVA